MWRICRAWAAAPSGHRQDARQYSLSRDDRRFVADGAYHFLPPRSPRLIEFLGLDWEPACLDFYKTERPVLTASAWQVRQPLFSRSVGRWRHY
jgi:hypothetical protein